MAKSQRQPAMLRDFAGRLRRAREAVGYDDRESFAADLGIKGPAYRKYERGEAGPPLEILVKISAATKVSLHWLLLGEGTSLLPNASARQRLKHANEEIEGKTSMKLWLLLIVTTGAIDRIPYQSQDLCEQAAKMVNERAHASTMAVCVPGDAFALMLGDEKNP